jgi:MFS family permease
LFSGAYSPRVLLYLLRYGLTLPPPDRLCLGLFMALMDMSIISTALFTISVDFKSYRQTIWAALAYILADIGCAVFFTRLADCFGRKQILLTSFFFFTVFSLACGFSQTVEQLIIFRTLQGIGGTGLFAQRSPHRDICTMLCRHLGLPLLYLG